MATLVMVEKGSDIAEVFRDNSDQVMGSQAFCEPTSEFRREAEREHYKELRCGETLKFFPTRKALLEFFGF